MALSPNFAEVKVEKATRLADEPELTVIKCFTPINSANFFSNKSLKRPVVNHPSKDASTMFSSSLEPISFPDGGITVSPGLKVFGANSRAAYSFTKPKIC